MATIREIYKLIKAEEKKGAKKTQKYTDVIKRPGSLPPVSFDMTPIPAGKFLMGSPEKEKGHQH